jgi:prepilin-type N-terminal cleavage/methylation domain-containing protein
MSHLTRTRKNLHGFTLIELMVVVAIVAFVSAAVVPSFALSLQRNRQREASMMVVRAVFQAHSRSARTGRCHRVTIDLDAPGASGGTGGSVMLEECTERIECSNAVTSGTWVQVSQQFVGGDVDHAGLVGDDIALSDVVERDGCASLGEDPVVIYFEPTGGPSVTIPNNARERFIEITPYDGSGIPNNITQHVRISGGGSVIYTKCELYQ